MGIIATSATLQIWKTKKHRFEGVYALPAEVLPYRLPTEADGLTKNSLVITELLA
jgi:hypothetical protein